MAHNIKYGKPTTIELGYFLKYWPTKLKCFDTTAAFLE